MDPLSVAASIIAVVGAADQAAKGVKKLLSVAQARDDVYQLTNEISDLEIFLSALRDASNSLKEAKTPKLGNDVPHLVQRAQVAVDELHDFVHSHLLSSKPQKNFGGSGSGGFPQKDKRFKPSYIGFVLKREKVTAIKNRVKDLQTTLSATLTAVNVTQLNTLSLNVEKIALQVDRLQANHSNSLPTIEDNIHYGNKQEHSVRTRNPKAQHRGLSKNENKDLALLQNAVGAATGANRGSVMRFDVSSQTQNACTPTCLCQCHRIYASQTPQPLKSVVGQLFLSYTGRPELRTTSCDILNCRRKTVSRINISYYFPEWFFGRTVWVASLWRDLHGIGANWTLRIPNVISFEDPIWRFLDEENHSEAAARFASGENTANDIDPAGRTLLDFCMWRSCTTIFMLHEYGARLDSETTGGISNAYLAYTRLVPLRGRRGELGLNALESLLGGADDVDTLDFSGLHSVVTGLLEMPPLQYLKSHPEEINAVDIGSATPLMWAIQCGNIDYALMLLDSKADPCMKDRRGETALHYACRLNANSKVLRLIKRLLSMNAPVNEQDLKGKTPLSEAAGKGMRKIVEILLKHGADVNMADFYGQPPLQWAIRSASTKTVLLLVKHGAQLNFLSSHGEDTVLFVARHASISTMQALTGLSGLQKARSGTANGRVQCPWCSLIEYRPKECSTANRPKIDCTRKWMATTKEELEAFSGLMLDKFEDYHKLASDGRLLSSFCDAVSSETSSGKDSEPSPPVMPGSFPHEDKT